MRSGARFLDVLLGFQLGLFAAGQFFGRRDDDHVAITAHVQALEPQHHVQHLVPGHVLQAQRDAAGHRVGDHDVLAAGVRDQLQHRAGVDVLEGQRHALAGVDRASRQRCALAARRGCSSMTYWSSAW